MSQRLQHSCVTLPLPALQRRLPPWCHPASQLCGLACAGPADQLSPLVAKLAADGVFTREVDTLGIAYHSPALQPLTTELRKGGPPLPSTLQPCSAGLPSIP